MRKQDLVDLFLRSKSITVLAVEDGLFDRLASGVISTVSSRFKYSNFSISPNKTLRSPYFTDQYLRYCSSGESLQDSETDETIVVYGNGTNCEVLESFPQSCSFVRLED